MNKAEAIKNLHVVCDRYNEEIAKEAPNANTLIGLEEAAKENVKAIKAFAKAELFAILDETANPMLEAARTGEYQHESYTIDKETGLMAPAIKTATIRAAEYTAHLMKLAQNVTNRGKYPQNGVFVNGHKWEYMCEKLALLLAYRTAKELGFDKEGLGMLLQSYPVREAAQKEKDGCTPTSNSQLLKLLQPIIDALVWVDNGKGGNAVKANGKDIAFLVDCFASHGKGIGSVKILKGTKLADYVFEAVHMIVTGKAYDVQYKTKSDKQGVTVRTPVVEVSKSFDSENDSASEAASKA